MSELATVDITGIDFTKAEVDEMIDTISSKGYAYIQQIVMSLREFECIEGMLNSAPPDGVTLSEYLVSIGGMMKAFSLFSMIDGTIRDAADEFNSDSQ